MHQPSHTHCQAVKCLLRYLKSTIHHGLLFHHGSNATLHVYTDADWVGDHDDRTSTSAYVIYLGLTPISWSSKKQRTVARSSTEAEYRAVAHAVAETNWLTNLLKELRISLDNVPTIYCNNIGTTYLCQNPVFHSRMKHIAIDFHFVRDQVQRQQLRLVHVHSADQLADILTKSLSKAQTQWAVSKLGVVPPPANLRGHKEAK
ncbi:hypothetical protein MTR67_051094 [Solanum verrucosum]|uniref:Uncharacterized protein n=1 Tax=Solanum verrucosum TaxID=315347 RepID=A0AAF1A2G0_SOLVR|nr:hypothetical protein MTR67_051094 [Solanum verrucosum]